MIQTQSDGSPITQAFIDAASQPFVGYDVKLYSGGVDTGWGIQRLSVQLGAGASQGDAFEDFALGGLQSSQMEGTLYDVAADPVGSEVELRVGVEVSEGAYEYVTVAHMTVTSAKEWQGITTFRAAGFGFKLNAPLGISGDLSPSQIATAVEAACGVPVALGAFAALPSAVPVGEGATCRRAIEELALRCAGYACETAAGGVMVAPFETASTCAIREDIITAAPEVGEEWQADGLTVTAAEAEYTYGTGRVKASVPEATQQIADIMWGNLTGYAYTPARIKVAVADPRITPFDVMAVTYGQGTVNVPARGIELTCDGGYFGTFSAAGLTAEAEEALVEGELTRGVRTAKAAAEEAQAVADAVNQHFWTDQQGIHVTELEQDEFIADPAGANILENANGILLRDGETWLSQFTPGNVAFYDGEGNDAENVTAVFGKDGAQVGADGGAHMQFDSDSITGYSSALVRQFDIDMNGGETNVPFRFNVPTTKVVYAPRSRTPEVVYKITTEPLPSDTAYIVENLSFVIERQATSVTQLVQVVTFSGFDNVAASLIDNHDTVTATIESATVTNGAPFSGTLRFIWNRTDGYEFTYTISVDDAHRITFELTGYRYSYASATDYSYFTFFASEGIIGYNLVTTSPAMAFGLRYGTLGRYSVALGEGIEASSDNQTAIGKYNEPSNDAAFMLGNGEPDNLSNAMTVDWDGNMVLSGTMTDGDGRSLADMENYLPLAGGTLTGALSGTEAEFASIAADASELGDATAQGLIVGDAAATDPSIQFLTENDNANTRALIQAHDRGTVNGHNLVVRAGGNLVAGGGEYATNRYGVGDITTLENAYIGADGTVYIETNANSIENRRTFYFGTTGTLMLANQDGIDTTAENPSAQVATNPISWRDEAGVSIGQLRATRETDGRISTRLIARTGTGSNIKQNIFSIFIDAAGNCTYNVSDQANFRKAIGLTPTSPISDVTQIATAHTGFSFTGTSYYTESGNVASIIITVKTANALNAGTSHDVIQMVAGKRPRIAASATVHPSYSKYGNVALVSSGNLVFRPSANVAAGETIAFCCTYILA